MSSKRNDVSRRYNLRERRSHQRTDLDEDKRRATASKSAHANRSTGGQNLQAFAAGLAAANRAHLMVPILLRHGSASWGTVAMIDSGATGNFLSQIYLDMLDRRGKNSIPCTKKHTPTTAYLIDGTPRSVEYSTEDMLLIMRTQDGRQRAHREVIRFEVISCRVPVILGYPGLRKHSASIDWVKGTIGFESVECQRNCLVEREEVFPNKPSAEAPCVRMVIPAKGKELTL